MSNKEEKKLHDFYQAVVLKATGVELLRLERNNTKFVTFVFSDSKGIAESTLKKYWERNLSLQARDLIETINELKTKIYSNI